MGMGSGPWAECFGRRSEGCILLAAKGSTQAWPLRARIPDPQMTPECSTSRGQCFSVFTGFC